jgi:hypothetical protein
VALPRAKGRPTEMPGIPGEYLEQSIVCIVTLR